VVGEGALLSMAGVEETHSGPGSQVAHQVEVAESGGRRLTALIVDWGGVLTDPLHAAMTSWATSDGVDFAHFAEVMRDWVGDSAGRAPDPAGNGTGDAQGPAGNGTGDAPSPAGSGAGGVTVAPGARGIDSGGIGSTPPDDVAPQAVVDELEAAARRGLIPASPVHLLERGEISIQDFERRLAAALGERGSDVDPNGLLGRVLGGLAELRDDMLGLVRRARHSGLRTALLSNSWGDEAYPEEEWEGAFDVVVISGRVGMRKPEEAIFRHTATLLGVPTDQCVMVDDLAGNIRGAVATGMVGVLHTSYEETAEELEVLFDRKLR
jgi:HAD superfamily hydrolase (TIGR01509 family)